MPTQFLRSTHGPEHTVCGAHGVKPRKLLERLFQGSLNNVSFTHLARLMARLGFRPVRIRGSHHIYAHPSIAETVNLQPLHGQAKPYQLRQILALIRRYNLTLEDEP